MRQIFLILTALILSTALVIGQEEDKVIEGKSKVKSFNFEPKYERGLPPNLFVDLDFKDENRNGIIEAREKATLELTIKNKGKGPAQGLKINIKDNNPDQNFMIKDEGKQINFIRSGESKKVTIPLKAGFDVKTAKHKLEINVKEHFGYDMDPAYLVLNTMAYQKPKLTFSGMEIVDQGEGTGAIKTDGRLQAGEQVKAKIVVQNVGQNVAKNTRYWLESKSDNIYLEDKKGTLGDLDVGEVAEFWVTISPNKRVDKEGNLPVYLTLNEKIGEGSLFDFQLPLKLDQEPPEKNVKKIKADIGKLQKQVARFEYSSEKFKANVGDIIDIRQVPPSETERQNAVAVVIGVENYENLPPAPYAANDAEIIKKYFKNRLGIEQVVTLTNDEVSGFAFDDIFNPDYGELQKAIVKGKTDVFVFYSGHGLPSKDGENVYLFPADGKVERIEQQGYNINKLYKSLEKLEARSVTVFMDACFSGASKSTEDTDPKNLIATKGVRIEPKIKQPWEKNKNFTVFSSSDAGETSLGFDKSNTGLFTYYLCAGMQGKADKNDDRKVTMGELKQYVKKHVKNTSKKIRGLQSPQFHGNEDKVLFEY
jgi:hypothetical protein